MKTKNIRYCFAGIIAVLIILCGMKFNNVYKDYQELQFKQEQIDTQVSVLMSKLYSALYRSDPINAEEVREYAAELSVLLPVTSYVKIPHFNDIANQLVETSEDIDARSTFSEQTLELFQNFIYNLGKPLPNHIDEMAESLYEAIV